MAKRRTTLSTGRFLKAVLIAPVAILGIVVVYELAGTTDGIVAGWSAPLKAAVGAGVVAVLWIGRRFLARDLAEADLARVRAAARKSGGVDVPAGSDEQTATDDTSRAGRSPEDATALATYLAARTALTDVIGSVDTPVTTALEPNARHVPAINTGATRSASALAASTADIQEAARQIATVCELLAQRSEADRLDRRAFADALMVLAQRAFPSVSKGPQRARSVSVTSAPPNEDRRVLVNRV